MKVSLEPILSDVHIDANQSSNQRQLSVSIAAVAQDDHWQLPLNLCLVLDRSGSMKGRPLKTVKQAALSLVERLKPGDRLSIVSFNHKAEVLVSNQVVADMNQIKAQIQTLQADGGTAIDEGMKLGIQEIAQSKKERVSQIFLLTDGENEHGDNQRCLKLAQLAAEYNITLNALGFGANWNQDVLEQIADSAAGTLCYIEHSEQVLEQFSRLFTRLQSVGLTNAYLLLELIPQVRLAELKPVAQVAPETVELSVQEKDNQLAFRLGDLMTDTPRILLINLYLNQLSPGWHSIAQVQVCYDDPATGKEGLLSEKIPVEIEAQQVYQPQPNAAVQTSILTIAKYRQTQIAEAKLQEGDRVGAATLLQTAAQTALQLGDQKAATVLQTNATRLQVGEELSEEERKKTRIAAKTTLKD